MTESTGATVEGAADRAEHADAELARLWLGALQEVADRAAHEVRGALNGVSLNLEVVRARAEKPGTQPSAVVPFASAAADELDVLTGRAQAILALARAPRRPVDVRATVRHLIVLLDPASRSGGGSVALDASAGEGSAATDADPEAARLVVTATLLAASGGERSVLCRIATADAIILRVEGASGSREIAPEILRVAADAGIGIEFREEATIVTFPAHAR